MHMWCLTERMPGRPFSPWYFPHPESQRNLTRDLADLYIRLAALPLEGVGALCLNPSGEKGKVVIGPSDLYLPLRDDLPTDPPTATLLGPWPPRQSTIQPGSTRSSGSCTRSCCHCVCSFLKRAKRPRAFATTAHLHLSWHSQWRPPPRKPRRASKRSHRLGVVSPACYTRLD